jgi:hypothetical protein
LAKELVSDSFQKPVELKELGVIIGILVDFLSENNTKIREKSEETLKAMFDSTKFGFNDMLISILSKNSKTNKAITRYNHCKLNFLINLLKEKFEPMNEEEKDQFKKNFPTALLLEFVEKCIVLREKVLNRSLRDKVEYAYIISYENSNYDGIKDYISGLDKLLLANLSKRILELIPHIQEDDHLQDTNRQMADDTGKRIAQLRKDRLKNLKIKHNADNNIEIDASGALTDTEHNRNTRRKEISKTLESRNLSIDKIRRQTDCIIDRQTEKLKDKIRKNLKAMKISSKNSRAQTGDISKSKFVHYFIGSIIGMEIERLLGGYA